MSNARTIVLILALLWTSLAASQPPPPGEGAARSGRTLHPIHRPARLPPGVTQYHAPEPAPTPIYGAQPETFNPPDASSYIYRRVAGQVVQDRGEIQVTASCLPGEKLLGGGFQYGTSDSPILVRSSYPSSESEWTSNFISHNYAGQDQGPLSPPFSASVYSIAYCLDPNGLPVDVVTVSSDNSAAPTTTLGPNSIGAIQSWNAVCPSGSVVTGGGYQLDGSDSDANSNINVSQPLVGPDKTAVGWSVTTQASRPDSTKINRAFVRCATAGIQRRQASIQNNDLTKLAVAIGTSVLTTACEGDSITTGGGNKYVGDWLIPHWLSASYVADPSYHSWLLRVFGGYQTTTYSFRPCDPGVSQCLEADMIAACFAIPDYPYINVRILSPPNEYAFGDSAPYPPSGVTKKVAFTSEVYDSTGKPIPGAMVRWSYTVPGTGQTETVMGTGKRVDTVLPAGSTLSTLTIKATAIVRRPPTPKGPRHALIASDTIKVQTGTVP